MVAFEIYEGLIRNMTSFAKDQHLQGMIILWSLEFYWTDDSYMYYIHHEYKKPMSY